MCFSRFSYQFILKASYYIKAVVQKENPNPNDRCSAWGLSGTSDGVTALTLRASAPQAGEPTVSIQISRIKNWLWQKP